VGEWKPASFYDDAYRTDPNLTADADVSTFGPLWREMARRVPMTASVIEIGCGAGQLASLVVDNVASYNGVDSSAVAIDAARKRVNAKNALFSVADAGTLEIAWPILRLLGPPGNSKPLIVACEVFEHLPGDQDTDLLLVFRRERVLLSLPTRDSESHVRFFPTEESVRERYGAYIDGMTVEPFDQWWIVEGRAK
jgi:SAM-dependent methyltransferase